MIESLLILGGYFTGFLLTIFTIVYRDGDTALLPLSIAWPIFLPGYLVYGMAVTMRNRKREMERINANPKRRFDHELNDILK